MQGRARGRGSPHRARRPDGYCGAGRAGTDCEATAQLGLAGHSECRSFLVADTDPLDLAASDGVGKRVERVADQAEYLLDPAQFKHADQNVCNCLCHLSLLTGVITHAPVRRKESGVVLQIPWSSGPIPH
jgi:hypothetical protein